MNGVEYKSSFNNRHEDNTKAFLSAKVFSFLFGKTGRTDVPGANWVNSRTANVSRRAPRVKEESDDHSSPPVKKARTESKNKQGIILEEVDSSCSPLSIPDYRLTLVQGKVCEVMTHYEDPETEKYVPVPEEGLDSIPKYRHIAAHFEPAPPGAFILSMGDTYR